MVVSLYFAIGTIFAAIFVLNPKILMLKGKEHEWDSLLEKIRKDYGAGALSIALTLFTIRVFLLWPAIVIKKIIRLIKGKKK